MLGLFTHSIILPLLQNNENQENNQRNLFIDYLLVIFTYVAFGIIGFISFFVKNFNDDLIGLYFLYVMIYLFCF